MTSLDSVTDVTIIDPSGAPISFRSDFSAFNPGGPEIGARVDHPHFEFAQFSSSVSGPGVGDFHGCATSIATPSCGVVGPDSSSIFFEIDQSQVLEYDISIFVQVIVTPEPSTMPLVASAFAILLGITKRQRIRVRV
jgi:hypothetical protein